jgi:predicted RNA-binding protein YlxR (DUF448 family)
VKPRHVPIRTCAGCRQEHPKREMIRVVRTAADGVLIDPTGKLAGRGSYVCARQECWTAALRGSLAHALKTEIAPDNRAELLRHAQDLISNIGPSATPVAESALSR